jgi:transposase
VIEHIRIQYTCRKCETIKMAKAVELPILKSKAGSSLICEVMLKKL